jgi:hypothetical protein
MAGQLPGHLLWRIGLNSSMPAPDVAATIDAARRALGRGDLATVE